MLFLSLIDPDISRPLDVIIMNWVPRSQPLPSPGFGWFLYQRCLVSLNTLSLSLTYQAGAKQTNLSLSSLMASSVYTAWLPARLSWAAPQQIPSGSLWPAPPVFKKISGLSSVAAFLRAATTSVSQFTLRCRHSLSWGRMRACILGKLSGVRSSLAAAATLSAAGATSGAFAC